jgi:hypothetical protein
MARPCLDDKRYLDAGHPLHSGEHPGSPGARDRNPIGV